MIIEKVDAVSKSDLSLPDLEITPEAEVGFSDLVTDKLESVNQHILTAETVLEKMANGEQIELHEAMISMQQAKKNLTILVEARNKVLEAYQEVMRMQI